MLVPWLLLFFSLVLGSRPWVFSLEKLTGSQDDARCSQGLSCHLWDDVLCLLETIKPPKDPVLVPTKLQTEVVLRCREETNCVPCVRVTLHLTVQEPRKEDPDEDGFPEDAELTYQSWPRNESLQARIILSFQAYHSERCVLVEVEVPVAMVQPGQNVGSLVFDCFKAPLGGEVRIWSYTQPPYQKELNQTQLLPDCVRPELQDSVRSCRVLPWFNLSAEGDSIQLVLDVSTEQNYILLLYWNQTRNLSTRFHEVLTGPQNITLNQTDLVPCFCIQVGTDPDILGPLRNDILLLETWGPQESHSFCAMETSGCTPLSSMAHTRAALLGKQLLQDLQSGQCVQLWNDTGILWACSLQKYTHERWVLVWLAFLVLAACILLLLLLNRGGMKGWLQFLKDDYRYGGAVHGRRALLLYSPDHASFERLVGTLATALRQLQLSVAVDLWHRRELSALGPLAWFHAQRRQALQEGGVVILLFSPGAVALCQEWLQEAGAAQRPAPTADTFAASLSCVLPDFLEGRAVGCYVVACFEELLPPRGIPDVFQAVPVFSLPSQMPAFLRALLGPGKRRQDTLRAHATRVGQYLQPALEECRQLGSSSSL
ncbi:interleukin-17 receptor C [Petaurus breviceps papuanus]|uniref:interleukin-17 receptor C n=1 Tax=Petaurus breviceps papuanus TaxID=3040969 RepID=UPI0036D8AEAE